MSRSPLDYEKAEQMALRAIGEWLPYDESFDALEIVRDDKTFSPIESTTWATLERKGFVSQADIFKRCRLTGSGWIAALGASGKIDSTEFCERIGRVFASFKARIKPENRFEDGAATVDEIAAEADVPDCFIRNVIESRLSERHYGKIGARWEAGDEVMQNDIVIPVDFGHVYKP